MSDLSAVNVGHSDSIISHYNEQPDIGNHEKCQLQNKYVAPYETCFLVYLFKLSQPQCLHQDCEAKFGMQKSHLSVVVNSFSEALFKVSHKYLIDLMIWSDHI